MRMLSVPVLASFLGLCSPALFALDEALLQYAGPNVTDVAGVDASRLASWPPAAATAQGFMAAYGRVSEVIVFAYSKGSGGGQLVAARADIDNNKARLLGPVKENYRGFDLYRGQKESDRVAFPETGLVLHGEENTLKAALDRRGTAASELDPALREKVIALSQRYALWGITNAKRPVNLGKAKLANQNVELVTGGVNLDPSGGARFEADILMKAEADARAFLQLINFLAGMDPNAKLLAQAVESKVEGRTVVLSMWATPEVVRMSLAGVQRKLAPAKAATR